MAQAQDRMLPDYARAGVAHHHARLFPPLALITMHRTFGAIGFFLAEPAAFQAHVRIGQELFAPGAQATGVEMMVAAVNPHHGRHGLAFARQTFASQVIFPRGLSSGCKRHWFNRSFHPVILAPTSRAALDSSQKVCLFCRKAAKFEDADAKEQDIPAINYVAGYKNATD
jgi:hypothetical protein